MSILSITKKITHRLEKKKPKKAKGEKAKEVKAEKKAVKKEIAPFTSAFRVLPILSEKSVNLQEENTAVFAVPYHSSKRQIAAAVAGQYKVEVKKVRTMTQRPKTRRRGNTIGATKRWKKAYVVVDNLQAIGTGP